MRLALAGILRAQTDHNRGIEVRGAVAKAGKTAPTRITAGTIERQTGIG